MSRWRRWRPKKYRIAEPQPVVVAEPSGIFMSVERRVKQLPLGRQIRRDKGAHNLQTLRDDIQRARQHVETLERSHAPLLNQAEAWLWLLVLQGPQAAEAQQQMDKHPQGYRDKNARLFELIDFNDAFVSSALACPRELLPFFAFEVRRLINQICQKTKTRSFSNEQFEAIVHGLSREIAVYLAAQKEGFDVEMTSRADDAFGVDMRIIDPYAMKMINLDIKTRSAFHYRIRDLGREGRLSEEEFIMADRNSFATVYNGRDEQRVKVILLRIDHEMLGDIVDFEFTDTQPLGEMLRNIIRYTGDKI